MRTSRIATVMNVAGLLWSLATISVVQAQVIYVDADATGAETGSTWTDAYTDLQSALAWATSGWEVWIAEGQYIPTAGTDRAISFVLLDGVALYGGFDGSESTRDERDWLLHESVLSGDIGVPIDSTDNSYHVIVANGVGATTHVDGITIAQGMARGGTAPHDRGAGILAIGGSPTIRNTYFYQNIIGNPVGGLKPGAGLYVESGSPLLEDCVFEGNRANRGGGAHFSNSTPTLRRVTLRNNSSSQLYFVDGSDGVIEEVIVEDGGNIGVFVGASSPTFRRVTFRANIDKGALIIEDGAAPIFEDCLFENNQSINGGAGAIISQLSSSLFIRTTFINNNAEGSGGAVEATLSDVVFIDCRFERNVSQGSSGALFSHGSAVTMIGGVIVGNQSASNNLGAALTIDLPPHDGGLALIANTVIVGNTGSKGGGMRLVNLEPADVHVVNTTIAYNEASVEGGGIYTFDAGTARVENTILFGNNAPMGSEIFLAQGAGPQVTRSLVAGGYAAGTDILDADPLFVRNPDPGPDTVWGTADDDYGDLRLRAGSPAVDYGLQSLLPPDIWDLDNDGNTTEPLPIDLNGDPRVQGPNVDLGAYEGAVIVANEPEVPPTSERLVVYPNPVSDRLSIEGAAGAEAVLFDVLGRAVLRQPLVGGRAVLDVSRLPAGVYVVRVGVESRLITIHR